MYQNNLKAVLKRMENKMLISRKKSKISHNQLWSPLEKGDKIP